MVAHHEELHCKLESLIDLLSAQHMKGDGGKGHNACPSCVEERESEIEGRGLWSTIPSRQMREGVDYPIYVVKIQIPTFHGLDPLG